MLFFVDNIFFIIVVVVVGELQTQREQHKLTIVMDCFWIGIFGSACLWNPSAFFFSRYSILWCTNMELGMDGGRMR